MNCIFVQPVKICCLKRGIKIEILNLYEWWSKTKLLANFILQERLTYFLGGREIGQILYDDSFSLWHQIVLPWLNWHCCDKYCNRNFVIRIKLLLKSWFVFVFVSPEGEVRARVGPVFGGESFGRSCDERELCSWKMKIENVNFVYVDMRRNFLWRGLIIWKLPKWGTREQRRHHSCLALGPQVAFALLCFNRATPTFAFFCINPISEYCNSEPQPISLLPWYTLYCFVVDYRWCTRVILN